MPSKMYSLKIPFLSDHPRGLAILFFTELWERFSYYGMRAILVLYLVSKTNSENPGLGWTNSEAIQLYGWYTALVYLLCIPGGLLLINIFLTRKLFFMVVFYCVLVIFLSQYKICGFFITVYC